MTITQYTGTCHTHPHTHTDCVLNFDKCNKTAAGGNARLFPTFPLVSHAKRVKTMGRLVMKISSLLLAWIFPLGNLKFARDSEGIDECSTGGFVLRNCASPFAGI